MKYMDYLLVYNLIQWFFQDNIYQAALSWTYPIAFNQFHSTTSNYSQASESKWQGYSAYSTLTYGIIYADSINNNYIGSCSFITIGY